MTPLAIAIGGGLGALARYALGGYVAQRQRTPFPLNTFVVNVTGCAGLGLLAGAVTAGSVPVGAIPWLVTGFFGGYTTFSTVAYENMKLIEDGAWRYALVNVSTSAIVGFALAALGYLVLS